MAAPCRRFARSAIEAGLQHLSSRNLRFMPTPVQSSRLQCCMLQHGALYRSSSSLLNRTKETVDNTKDQEQKNDEEHGPEYIPKRKAKNPMKVVGYAWIFGLPAGIIGFILAKRQVDKNRLQQLKIRQRMKKSNEGEYERERYRPAVGETESVEIRTV